MATELRRVLLRRGTTAEWNQANPVLEAGEEGYETDTGFRKVGDGISSWNLLDYNEGKPGPQGIPGVKGDPGPAGTIPASGIPTRALYVENNGSYPTIAINTYKEFLGVTTPPVDKTLPGDIWTKLATSAPIAQAGSFSSRMGTNTNTTYTYTFPTLASGGPAAGQIVILTCLGYTNTPATWAATLGTANRPIEPIQAPFLASGWSSAIYVFKADAATAGSTFTITLTANAGSTITALTPSFMGSWFTGLKGTGTQGTAITADVAHSALGTATVKTGLTKVTSVGNTVEFTAAMAVDSTDPVPSVINFDPTVTKLNQFYHTTQPDPLMALGAILKPVPVGTTIGGRSATFTDAAGTLTGTGAFGCVYTFNIEADAPPAPSRLAYSGSAWELLDGTV